MCGHECAVDLVKRIAESAGDTMEVRGYLQCGSVVSDRRCYTSQEACRTFMTMADSAS